MTRTFSDNYDLDLQIAESNGITIDHVDQIPLPVVEIIRDYFHRENRAAFWEDTPLDLGESE